MLHPADPLVLACPLVGGGWRRSRSFTGARIIDATTLEAWRQIDAGRRTATADTVADGNPTLLFREQHDIIGWVVVILK
jgi:hypothetical protein